MSIVIVGGLVVLLLQTFIVSANNGTTKAIVATFSNPYINDEYNRLVVHKETGNVYVGAVNRIYQLDKDLQIKRSYVTAGLADKNVNEVLVIDYERKMLIACGSTGGNCLCLSLDDISKVKTEYNGTGLISGVDTGVVAFIGTGPSNSTGLFLGTAKNITAQLSFRSLVPSEKFKILWRKEMGDRYLKMIYPKFSKKIVFGFSAEACSFYLLNEGGAWVVRVCHNGSNAETVHELKMYCKFIGRFSFSYGVLEAAYVGRAGQNLTKALRVDYQDEVLFAVFSSGDNCTVCFYAVKHLMSTLEEEFVGQTRLEFPTPKLTSISAVAVDENTIILLGTKDGTLKKWASPYYENYYGNEGFNAIVYGKQEVSLGNPLLPGMIFDNANEHLYVSTKEKILKIRIKGNCSDSDNCSDCVKKHPSCGWCTSTNSCSLKKMCLIDGSRSNPYFNVIPFGSDKCSLINYKSSPVIKVINENDIIMLNLTLPEDLYNSCNLTCKYQFPETMVETYAKSRGGNVLCLTPPTGAMPDIETGEHFVSAKLLIRSTQMTGVKNEHFISNFILYNCGTYTTCSSCAAVTSHFNCSWCFWDHQCKDSATCDIKDSKRCPSIITGNKTQEYLIPYGTTKRVEITTSLDHIVSDKTKIGHNYYCRFNIEGRISYTSSILFGDYIHCEAIQFVYSSVAPSIAVPVDVVFDFAQHVSLDNPSGFTIVIYRCQYMADDCLTCLNTETKFGSGWCDSLNQCTVRGNCGHGVNWISGSQTCPFASSINPLHIFIFIFIQSLLFSSLFAIFVILYRRKSRAVKILRNRMCTLELQAIHNEDETNSNTSVL